MYTHDKTSMFLRIHISKAYLQSYLPDVELYRINCFPEEITDEQFPEYYRICELLAELTRLYIMKSACPISIRGLWTPIYLLLNSWKKTDFPTRNYLTVLLKNSMDAHPHPFARRLINLFCYSHILQSPLPQVPNGTRY